jgi:hypothetical protein
MDIVIRSKHIEDKLKVRNIGLEDIVQCFANREGGFPEDNRPNHKTVPPTRWFIAEDDSGRLLKIVFMYLEGSKEIHVKSAFEPNSQQLLLYKKYLNTPRL